MYTVVVKLETKEQLEAMIGIIDQGVRASGLRAVGVAAILVASIQAAVEDGVVRVEKVEPVRSSEVKDA